MILYNYFRSSTSYRTRIALELKGLAYEYKAVNILKGEHHLPDYRKLNPGGGVPTLVDKGHAIAESVAIIEYLDEVYPQVPLYPKGALDKAQVRQFCEYINSSIHPMSNLRVMQYLDKNLGFDQNRKDEWCQLWISQGLQACEKMLEGKSGKFCFGDKTTAADVFLVPQMVTAERFKVDTSQYKVLSQIKKSCDALDAFKKAHPFRQIDTPSDLRIN